MHTDEHCNIITKKATDSVEKIHHGHQGSYVFKYAEYVCVAPSVWWLGVTSVIEQFVQACPTCQKLISLHREPLLITPLLNYPWEQITADLCELKGSMYLLVVDCFSRFIEVQKLTTTTSSSIVTHLCEIWHPCHNGHWCEMLLFLCFSHLWFSSGYLGCLSFSVSLAICLISILISSNPNSPFLFVDLFLIILCTFYLFCSSRHSNSIQHFTGKTIAIV